MRDERQSVVVGRRCRYLDWMNSVRIEGTIFYHNCIHAHYLGLERVPSVTNLVFGYCLNGVIYVEDGQYQYRIQPVI